MAKSGTRDLSIIAGVASLNGHVRFVSSSRGEELQSVQAVFPGEDSPVISNSFTLFWLPKASTRAEALEFVAGKFVAGSPERTYLDATLARQLARIAPKVNATGKQGKPKTDWRKPLNVAVEPANEPSDVNEVGELVKGSKRNRKTA